MQAFRVFKIFLLVFLLALGGLAAQAADLYFDATTQFNDSRGRPLSGGTIETFDAGTTTQRTTYQDSGETTPHANPITLGSDGRIQTNAGQPASMYITTGSWKYILRDGQGATIRTVDNLPGALDTTAFQTTFARRICDVITRTSTYSAVADDLGKCIEANAAGGAFSVSLPSAITVGNGAMLTVRKSDASSNVVTVTTVGGQTIGGTGSSVQLATQGSLVEVVSDGANWQPNNSTAVEAGSITIGQLDPGLAGLIPKVGTPILWLNDVCPAGYLPADGSTQVKASFQDLYNLWSANGTRTSLYGESGDNFNMPDSRGYFPRFVDGGAGRDPNAATRTARPDGTGGDTVGTTQDWATDDHTHDPLIAGQNIIQTGGATAYQSAANAGQGASSTGGITPATSQIATEVRPKNFYYLVCILASPQAVVGTPVVTNTIRSGPGVPVATDGQDGDFWIDTASWEIYLKTGGTWVRQTNIVGIAQLDYRFDSTTTEAEPDSIRLNSTTSANVTEVYIRDTGAAGQAYAAFIATWDDSSTQQDRGQIKITRRGFDDRYIIVRVTGASDTAPTNYTKLAVAHVSSSNADVTQILADGDKVQVAFTRSGDAGTAPGISYTFNTSTVDSRPGAGLVRLNNTDAAQATQAYLDNIEAFGNDIRAVLLEWDQSTTLDNRGQLYIVQTNDPDTFAVYNITGPNDTTETDYVKLTITHVDSKFPGSTTTFPNNAPLSWLFIRTGDIGGPGDPGPAGTDPGTRLDFNAIAGVSDPGSGRIKFNNTTIANVTRLSVSKENGASPAANIADWVLSWDSIGNAGSRGIVHIAKRASPDTDFAIFDVTGNSNDNTGTPGWVEVIVTHRSSAGSFTAADPLSVQFIPAGADGTGNVTVAYRDVTPDAGETIVATLAADNLTVTGGPGVSTSGVAATKTLTVTADHNALTNYAANDHIDWTAATNNLVTTGTGSFTDRLSILGNATNSGRLSIREQTTGGTEQVNIGVPALAANYTLTLPVDDGAPNQVLQTDGNGVLSWVAQGGGLSAVVDDPSPQLGGNLDTNNFFIDFPNARGIRDGNGNELILFAQTGGAVNYLEVKNAPTGADVIIQATGTDTNVELQLQTKGSGNLYLTPGGNVQFEGMTFSNQAITEVNTMQMVCSGVCLRIDGNVADAGKLSMAENTGNGTNTMTLAANENIANNFTLTFPNGPGGAGQVLTSDGSGNLGWSELTGRQTIWIPGSAMTPSGTAGATTATRELADGQPTLSVMNYVHTSNTSAQFSFKFPGGADAASSITYQVGWTAAAGTATQTVFWRLACLARGDNEALGTAFGTAANSNDSLQTVNAQHDSDESATLTIAGTLAAGKTVYCRLLRDTADTLEQTVEAIGVTVFYKTLTNTD